MIKCLDFLRNARNIISGRVAKSDILIPYNRQKIRFIRRLPFHQILYQHRQEFYYLINLRLNRTLKIPYQIFCLLLLRFCLVDRQPPKQFNHQSNCLHYSIFCTTLKAAATFNPVSNLNNNSSIFLVQPARRHLAQRL